MDVTMDRSVLRRANSEKQRGRIDRFIASRDDIGLMRDAHRRHSWQAGSYPQGTQNTDTPFYLEIKKQKYIRYLEKAFEIVPQRNNPYNYMVRPWPCAPRKRSYLSSADSILDLPTYRFAIFPEIIDWSANDILVAALGRNYHMWSWTSQKNLGSGSSSMDINCCKFDPTGKYLLIGTSKNIMKIHDIKTNNLVSRNVCLCSKRNCAITAIDWSPTGEAFVSGCSNGVVTYYSRSTMSTHKRHLFKKPIIIVRVSPDARHLAVAGYAINYVKILSWPDLEVITFVQSESTIRTMAWHPWKSSLLGIGTSTKTDEPLIIMYNVPTQKMEKSSLCAKRHSLETMLFSHKTGELILSLYHYDNSYHKSHLVVMSDFNTVVDSWGEGNNGLGRIDMMVFSPDGTKLATATSLEDLIIWNFLPEDPKKDATNMTPKKFSDFPVFLDKARCEFLTPR